MIRLTLRSIIVVKTYGFYLARDFIKSPFDFNVAHGKLSLSITITLYMITVKFWN